MVESNHHGLVPADEFQPPAESGPPTRRESGPQPSEESGGGLQWRRVASTVVRHKWLVVLCVVAGTGVGFLGGKRIAPVYETEATIWVESGGEPRGRTDRGPIQAEELLGGQGWDGLLRSFAVLDDAVRELKLYVRPVLPEDSALFGRFDLRERFLIGRYELRVSDDGSAWTMLAEDGTVVERGVPGDSVGATLGFDWVIPTDELVPGRVVDFVVQHPRETSIGVASRLVTGTDRNGTFLRARLSGSDPDQITQTLNQVATRFVELAAQLKREKLTELVAILETQLDAAGRNLQDAETELEDFKARTITLPSEPASPVVPGLSITRDPVFDNFFTMQVELDALGRDRESIERALASIQDSGLVTGALEVIEAVQGSSELLSTLGELTERRADLRALRGRYTDENVTVQRAVADIAQLERVVIPRLARELVSDLRSREDGIRERLGSASRQIRQIPARQVQEARLERRVEIAENLYTMLQARFEEARLAEVSSIPDVRILSRAVAPSRPVSDRAPQLLLMGVVGGIGLGIGLSVLLDRLDRRVRYPDQVTAGMGLDILGAVPHLDAGGNGAAGQGTIQVVEAIRGIRLNVMHAYGRAGPIVVTVSSPGSGDGKSFVSSNLALAFADAGHTTLLIDADTRRGRLHRTLGCHRKPGLVDLLSGAAAFDEVTQKTEHANLRFIPSGTRKGGAPELLGSPAMVRLLTSARSSHGVIIVDSPPLGAGVDAYALGAATGSLLVVLRTGITDREHAEVALGVLDRLPVRLLGAVLNDVRPGAGYGFYPSYYMTGYEVEDEATGEPKQLMGRRTTS